MTGVKVTGPGPALRNRPGVASGVVFTGLSRSPNIDRPYRLSSTTSQLGSFGPGATFGWCGVCAGTVWQEKVATASVSAWTSFRSMGGGSRVDRVGLEGLAPARAGRE